MAGSWWLGQEIYRGSVNTAILDPDNNAKYEEGHHSIAIILEFYTGS